MDRGSISSVFLAPYNSIGVEGVEVVVFDVKGDPVLVEVVDNFEGFERVPSQTVSISTTGT
ncbi:MAG: hypothetical protein IJR77_02740 [Bacteroidales bacterium]|nr:hypothetical protein [Bacteroidales bacterium]